MMPRATMRLQFHKGFTFADAEAHVSYLARLGISHVYASPITTARPGSMHGYDVIDPTRVNPELGGEAGLRRLVAALRAAGLGLIVDIVPNHMAVGHANAWWFDVLAHGQASRYAPYFDIDWNTEDEALRGKVLLPVLGRPLREALAAGEITLAREPDGLVAYSTISDAPRFPIAPRSIREKSDWPRCCRGSTTGSRGGVSPMTRSTGGASSTSMSSSACAWSMLAAFEDVHALIFRLYADGLIDGMRVDHIDGLADPAGYCVALRRRLDALASERSQRTRVPGGGEDPAARRDPAGQLGVRRHQRL